MIPFAAQRFAFILGLLILAACGGGGGGGDGPPVTAAASPPPAYVAGTFQPSSTFAARCAAPRSGIDPWTNRAYPDVRGSAAWENNFLRSWSQELYLWYRELPDLNPGSTSNSLAYFDLLKTPVLTSSGKLKDRFHFTYPTSE